MSKLYKTLKEPTKYGEYLTTDKDGKHVLKFTDGTYDAYDPDELENIVPYTVELSNGYHYVAKKGKLKVGNMVYSDSFSFQRVIATDTQRENAMDFPEGLVKLKTSKI